MGKGTGRGADGDGFVVGGGCCCLILIVSSILLGCSFDTLSPTQVGLDYDGTTLNVDYDTLYTNGRYCLGLAHHFIKFPTSLQTIEFADGSEDEGPLSCASSEGQQITLEISFMYRHKNDLQSFKQLYLNHSINYRQNIIKRAMSDIKNTATLFNTTSYFTERLGIREVMRVNLERALTDLFVAVEFFQLRDIQVPENFENKIVDKIVSAQEKMTAEAQQRVSVVNAATKVIQETSGKQISIIKKDASATGYTMESNAEANALETVIDTEAVVTKDIRQRLLDYPGEDGNDAVLKYLWTKAIKEDSASKLVIGLDNNVIVSAA